MNRQIVNGNGTLMLGQVAALAMACSLALGAGAVEQVATNTVDGVKWQIKIDTETRTASIGLDLSGSENFPKGVGILSPVEDVIVRMPSSFTVAGVDYTVTNVNNRAFYGLELKTLIGAETVERWGNYGFRSSGLQYLYIRGPATGTTLLDYAGDSFTGNRDLKYVLVDPTVRPKTGKLISFKFTDSNGATIFVPKVGWDGVDAYVGANNKVVYYGRGEELDIAVNASANTLTATPTTANALTNVLDAAAVFKEEFGLDTRINVTNAIEIGEGVITAEKLRYATFNSLMFKVMTQSQLDSVLAVVPASVPLAVDPSDAREELIVPQGREVYVRLSADGRNGKYVPKINGLLITFQ